MPFDRITTFLKPTEHSLRRKCIALERSLFIRIFRITRFNYRCLEPTDGRTSPPLTQTWSAGRSHEGAWWTTYNRKVIKRYRIKSDSKSSTTSSTRHAKISVAARENHLIERFDVGRWGPVPARVEIWRTLHLYWKLCLIFHDTLDPSEFFRQQRIWIWNWFIVDLGGWYVRHRLRPYGEIKYLPSHNKFGSHHLRGSH